MKIEGIDNQMVDSETTGNEPGCGILVIGAVRFDPFRAWPAEGQAIALTDRFKVRISPESNAKYGLVENPGTMKFWQEQSDEAREEAFGGTTDLKAALVMYREWLYDTFGSDTSGAAAVTTYCHGEDFDKPIIQYAMSKLGIPSPFPYNRTRDTRTVFELAGVQYKGTKHMVFDDCYGQCAALCRSHSILGFSRTANRLPGWLLPYEGMSFPVNLG